MSDASRDHRSFSRATSTAARTHQGDASRPQAKATMAADEQASPWRIADQATFAPASLATHSKDATHAGNEAANEISNQMKREILAASVHDALKKGSDQRVQVGMDVSQPAQANKTMQGLLDQAFAGQDAAAIAKGVSAYGEQGKKLDPPVEARADRTKLISWYADQFSSGAAHLRVITGSDARTAMFAAGMAQADGTQRIDVAVRSPVAGQVNTGIDVQDTYLRARGEIAGANGFQANKRRAGAAFDEPATVIGRSKTLSQLAAFGSAMQQDPGLSASSSSEMRQFQTAGSGTSDGIGRWREVFFPANEVAVEVAGLKGHATPAPVVPQVAIPTAVPSSGTLIIAPVRRHEVAPYAPAESRLAPADNAAFAAIVERNGAHLDAQRPAPRERTLRVFAPGKETIAEYRLRSKPAVAVSDEALAIAAEAPRAGVTYVSAQTSTSTQRPDQRPTWSQFRNAAEPAPEVQQQAVATYMRSERDRAVDRLQEGPERVDAPRRVIVAAQGDEHSIVAAAIQGMSKYGMTRGLMDAETLAEFGRKEREVAAKPPPVGAVIGSWD